MWVKSILQVDLPEKHLLYFPWAGSGIEGVFHWRRLMPPKVAFSGVQLPGRGSRFTEKPVCSLSTIVEEVVAEIEGLEQKPTVLYGHSFGALLAYEVCSRLEQGSSTRIERLVVSGASAPSWLSREERIAHLPDEEFLAKLKALNGIPEQVLSKPELLKFFLPILRADFKVYEAYEFERTRPPLRCPLVACAGREDTCTSEQGLEEWKRMTTGPVELLYFAGDHFFIEARASDILSLALA